MVYAPPRPRISESRRRTLLAVQELRRRRRAARIRASIAQAAARARASEGDSLSQSTNQPAAS